MIVKLFDKAVIKQGRIHGKTVTDSWTGSIMQKPLVIQQGGIHGWPVWDGWTGDIMQKPLVIQQGGIHGRTVADGWAGVGAWAAGFTKMVPTRWTD